MCHGELKQMFTHMLQNVNTTYYRIKDEFQLAQRGFLTYMIEDTYWQKIVIGGPMLSSCQPFL